MSLNKHLLSAYCLQGDSHFTKGFPVVCLQSESLSMHLNMICFINFNSSVYTHSLGINRFHTLRHFILKRSKRVDLAMFTEGCVEVLQGSRKSEANCSVWILAPTVSSTWLWASYLIYLHCRFLGFFFCLQNVNSNFPTTYGFISSIENSAWHV